MALVLLMFSPNLGAEEPWSVAQEHPVTAELNHPRRPPATLENDSLSRLVFQFYARYISPMDGQTCHYLPTCSAYGAEALERYGIFRGILMTTDRLIRCHPGQQEHPVDPPLRY